jgi:uncharacterized protein (DUF2147 family)
MSLPSGLNKVKIKKLQQMKKIFLLASILCLAVVTTAQSQSVVGKWKTIDDETGKPKSIVEVYEKSGKIYGKIVDILDPQKKDKLCTECTGDEKNKPVLGMVIVKGLQKDAEEYNDGSITDPVTGKKYKCFITLEGKDKLKVRGYIGFALMGRTQYWYRVK